MNNIHLLLICLVSSLLTGPVVFAQQGKVTFGKVPLDDLKLTSYNGDTTIAAAILYEKGYTHYTFRAEGIKLVTEHHIRIKLFSMMGYDPRSFVIHYYSSKSNPGNKEEVSLLQGFTHVLHNGKAERYKLESKHIYTQKTDEDWKARRFYMPGVEAGAVLEYRYTVESDFLVNLEGWNFQRELPVRWSEFELKIPEDYFAFDIVPQGNPSFAEASETAAVNVLSLAEGEFSTTTRRRWVMKNVPAFRELPMMSSPSQCAPRITVRLKSFQFPWQIEPAIIPGTWEAINDDLTNNPQFGELTAREASRELDGIVRTATASLTDPVQKMIALYDYVKNNIRWDGRMSKFMTSDVKRTLAEKTGNTADLNMLLVALLRKAGLSADPVIVSTRDQGNVDEAYLSIDQFNTMLVYTNINGRVYLLEPCNPLRPYDLLPVYALGEKGWRISADSGRVIKTESAAKSTLTLNAVLSLDEKGEISGSLQSEATGQNALHGREMSTYDSRERYVQECWRTAGTGVGLSSIAVEGISAPADLFKADCTIATDRLATVSGEEISFNPLLTRAVQENIFKDSTRNCAVDFGFPFVETYRFLLQLPAGYEVTGQPGELSIALPGGAAAFSYSISVTGQVMQVMVKLEINKDRFEPGEYGELRKFFGQMAAKQAEKVVMRKAKAGK